VQGELLAPVGAGRKKGERSICATRLLHGVVDARVDSAWRRGCAARRPSPNGREEVLTTGMSQGQPHFPPPAARSGHHSDVKRAQ
jgi:hypothetical protein